MRDNIDNEFETIGSDDAAKNNAAKHPTLGDASNVATDSEKVIRVCAQFMADTMKGFTKMFTDQDGMLIDLTDKAGRRYDRDFMLRVQSRIDQALERIRENLEEHCKAEFLPEDRKTMVQLNTNFANARSWVLGTCFLGAFLCVLGLFMLFNTIDTRNDMGNRCDELSSMAAFGSYCRQIAPDTYIEWQDAVKARQTPGKSNRSPQSEFNNK